MGINAKALPPRIRRQVSDRREARRPSRRGLPTDVTVLGAGHTVRVETGRDIPSVPGPVRVGNPPDAAATAADAATRVLGLDLAIGTTGWCLLVGGRPAAHGHFALPERLRRKAGEEPLADWLARRSVALGEQVGILLRTHRPEIVGYEYPNVARPHYSGGSKGREFAAVQGLARAEGMLVTLWTAIGGGIPLVSVPVTDVKMAATGRINANKDQIRLALMGPPRGWDLARWTDDEVDAAAVAVAAREML
jgi:Holliday junction resolvasome RuvABC endonuclease subunit